MEFPSTIRILPPDYPAQPAVSGRATAIFMAGFLMPILLWMPLGYISYARGTFDAGSLLGMAALVALLACINSVPYLLYAMMIEGKQLFSALPRKSLQRAYTVIAIGLSIAANGLYFFWPEPLFAGIYFMVPVVGGLLWVMAYAVEGWLGKRAENKLSSV